MLLEIINNVLDLAKIESGKLELSESPFNLRECVGSVISELRPIAQKKNIEMKCQVRPRVDKMVRGDCLRLKQVLLNLLNNAIKFTDNGTITLSVRKNADCSGSVKLQFSVRDTGIGISLDIQNKIFESFTQGDNSFTKKHSGTGLGLTISREIVETMSGEIWVDSEVGKGSIFHFTAVFGICESMDGETLRKPSDDFCESGQTAARSLTILCVEDNAANQQILTMFLNGKGHNCICADNGRKAIEILDATPVDLILMDVQMPELNGFDTTKLIREKERGKNTRIPIIAMTAYAMPGDDNMCIAAGMDDYISKPTDLELLGRKITRLAGSSIQMVM